MPLAQLVVSLIPVCVIVLGVSHSFGQTYPNKPVRLVTSPPGGGNDFVSRLIAQAISGALGQQVLVENRSGVIPGETVAKAPPDGYTLLLASGNLWITPLLQKTSYDPLRDFSPVTWATNSPNILVVHPSLPVRSVKELIALAKARPGELNYASSSFGASAHLAAELFKSLASVNMVHVPYKGSGDSITGLISGQVHLSFPPAGAVMTQVKAGKLRALAVTSSQPSVSVPDLPTLANSGVPGYGYDTGGATTIFGPAKTSAAIINRLHQEIVKVLNRSDMKDKLFSAGMEVVGSSPEELAATVKSDMVTWGKVIRDAGIRAD